MSARRSTSRPRACHLAGVVESGGHVERPAKRIPLHQFQHEVVEAVRLLEAVDRGDVRVVERRQRPRLAVDACQAAGVARELGRQRLDRDVAAELAVVGAVHLAHSAGADEGEEVVGPELAADQRTAIGHRGVQLEERRRLQEGAGALVVRHEDADLVAQIGLAAACFLEKGRTALGRPRERRVKELLRPSPALLVDGHRRHAPGSL
ncbi:MAG: hypothetical protein NTV05_12425 [Acidobacteria bacterium]|nr:hypothetical protein [Acidobacteriota bacterium]